MVKKSRLICPICNSCEMESEEAITVYRAVQGVGDDGSLIYEDEPPMINYSEHILPNLATLTCCNCDFTGPVAQFHHSFGVDLQDLIDASIEANYDDDYPETDGMDKFTEKYGISGQLIARIVSLTIK